MDKRMCCKSHQFFGIPNALVSIFKHVTSDRCQRRSAKVNLDENFLKTRAAQEGL